MSTGHQQQRRRPKFLTLWQIHLPLPGVLSILHRVSGVLLIAALPFYLAALHFSLDSAESYEAVAATLAHPAVKVLVWVSGWALFHHLCAGARFLLLDIHIGVELAAARASSVAAFAASLLLTVAFGVWLL